MKKKVSEKNLNLNDWVSAGPERIAEVKGRNEALRAAKDARFTARMSTADFEGLKKVASEKAIPYQTLLGHIVHEYIAGNLIDVKEVKKLLKRRAG